MASTPSRKGRCLFCYHDSVVLQDGQCPKHSNYAKICDACFTAFQKGTYCRQYHKDCDGWKECDSCERLLHAGCVMEMNSFDLKVRYGVTCKECVMIEKILELTGKAVADAENLAVDLNCPNSKEFLIDLGTVAILDEAIEGSANAAELPNSGLLFLFEKKLTLTDCCPSSKRLTLPKKCVEEFLPMPADKQKMPIVIIDTEERTWNVTLRSCSNKNRRKYILEGTRSCLQTMNWSVGDTLKFYRRLADGELIMDLEKAQASTSTA